MMVKRAQYTKALPVYVIPSVKARIEAVAEREDTSMAQVIRDIIDAGLEAREKRES
jgi:cytidylate kinase